MNVLFLSPIVPFPPVDGDRQRSYHLLQALARRHRVHLVCFLRSPEQARALKHLRSLCQSQQGVMISQSQILINSLRAWPTHLPLNVASFASAAMQTCIQKVLAENPIDVIHAYRLRMAPYALAATAPWRVLDYTDSLTRNFQNHLALPVSGWKQVYLRREAGRLEAYEVWASHQFNACLISSPRDEQTLARLGAAKLDVITNGVDTAYLQPAAKLTSAPRLLFVGSFHYAPNVLGLDKFCREIWPRIRAVLPQARLTIVGDGSSKKFSYPGLDWAGLVPDIRPYLHQARVAICPLEIASGRQFKVLEYLSAGVPTVATRLVADNLGALDHHHLLAADQPEPFAAAVLTLCRDNTLANHLRKTGRAWVIKNYDWRIPTRALEKIYQKFTSPNIPKRKLS